MIVRQSVDIVGGVVGIFGENIFSVLYSHTYRHMHTNKSINANTF